ncbi:hypothetical protein [Acidipropionibacterium virtanenii]|uniref:Uncharacterized protein n=1 Tax=Acidipropionibacterium virtanenii TaxID=2057246 RepID=A0A344UQ42_9ACTN|nr:hypothetical protein [Acidipropionibacterium virtanenii]AXE37390.1 hypothetical protein JS278_00193 [Acidipropionibacterium virtanenii]
MTRTVYQAISRIFAVVLAVAGIGLALGGNYAHGFVTDQLSQQKIVMPSGKALTSQDMKDHLEKYADKPMTTGPQAEAFANHYIQAHMNATADGKTYEEVSGEYIACSADNAKKNTAECTALGEARQTLFMGNSLRGMLLNAFGWWLLGTIAIWVGVGALVLAVILAVLGWFVLKPRQASAA